MKHTLLLSIASILLCFSSVAEATNGIYLLGYGAQSKAMGGACVAFPQETLVALTNPAGMICVGNRLDVGLVYAHNKYWEDISGNNFGKDGRANLNTFPNVGFLEGGYNRLICDRVSIGITAAPLTGGIVHHKRRSSDTPGEGPHKINVGYGAVSPCLSIRLNECHSLGASFDFVLAGVYVSGFQSIQNRDGTAFPGKVTNNGWDFAPGFGFRIGWLSQLGSNFWFGAAYRSETFMKPFDKYKGLFTPKGRVNLPQRVDLGIAYQPFCSTVFALDVSEVFYKSIRTWAGPAFSRNKPFWGAPGGPGLGWKNQYIIKLGVAHQFCSLCPNLTGRLGFNYANSPIRPSRTNNNNSTPATTRYHATAGCTWKNNRNVEWSVAYIAGIKNTIRGSENSIAASAGGGRSDLSSHTHQVELSYGLIF